MWHLINVALLVVNCLVPRPFYVLLLYKILFVIYLANVTIVDFEIVLISQILLLYSRLELSILYAIYLAIVYLIHLSIVSRHYDFPLLFPSSPYLTRYTLFTLLLVYSLVSLFYVHWLVVLAFSLLLSCDFISFLYIYNPLIFNKLKNQMYPHKDSFSIEYLNLQSIYFNRDLVLFFNFDPFRLCDLLSALVLLYTVVSSFLVDPNTSPITHLFIVTQPLCWILLYALGSRYIIYLEATKKFWTRHFFKHGQNFKVAFSNWKMYHMANLDFITLFIPCRSAHSSQVLFNFTWR